MQYPSSESFRILENLEDSYISLDDSFDPLWFNATAQSLCEDSIEDPNYKGIVRELGRELHDLKETSGERSKVCNYSQGNRERFVEWTLESTSGSTSTDAYLLIGRDVTRLQRELQETKSHLKHLSTIINSEPSCVKTIGRDGELIDMNPAGLHLIDAPNLDSVKGVSVYELMEGESLEKFKAFNERVFKGESGSLDFEITSLKGEKRHMRTYASPLRNQQGEVVMHVAVTNDVTEEIEKTQRLRESMDRAQAAAMAKGQFLANMSHEIRTPMNGVLGLSDLLLDTPLNDDQRKFAEGVHSSANSLLKLIDDILDFSKIQAGKLELNPRPSSLRIEMASIKQIFANQADAKGLDLLLEISPRVPNSLVIDPDRFKQIVINLLGNALKFTDKGQIGAKVDFDEQASSESANLVLEVYDTGIGISDENKVRIFESFTQGDAGFNRDYGGTGLGLSISNQLIELMNGDLQMDSQIGEGTSFRITIPIKSSQDPSDSPCAPQTSSLDPQEGRNSLSILLAEDNQLNQTYALRVLEKAGHRVTLVENGMEAISAIKNNSFDVVLMDIQMPVVDGEQATREIRKIDRFENLPIAAITANAMSDAKDRFLDIGMNSVLSKPFSKTELLELVDHLGGGPDQPGRS